MRFYPHDTRNPRLEPAPRPAPSTDTRGTTTPHEPTEDCRRMWIMLHHLEWCSNVGQYDNPYAATPPPDRESLLDDVIQLKCMIPRLSYRDRLLVTWIGLRHLPEEEVARRLGMSQPAVNKRLLRIARWVVAA